MMQKVIVLAVIFSCAVLDCKADSYPRNPAIDIQHYRFEIGLSDSSDMVYGKAFITLVFKKSDSRQVRLDLISKTEKLAGKGMVVSAVLYDEGIPSYTHANDELLIKLLKAPEINRSYTFVISYQGIPASGLRIGATRYGNRSFFSVD